MAKTLELVEYDANSHPISARCYACRVQMPLMKSEGASDAEISKWFAIQFDLPVRQKHSREDVNKAAARIVRKATGG